MINISEHFLTQQAKGSPPTRLDEPLGFATMLRLQKQRGCHVLRRPQYVAGSQMVQAQPKPMLNETVAVKPETQEVFIQKSDSIC